MTTTNDDLPAVLEDPAWWEQRLTIDFPGRDWSHAAALIASAAAEQIPQVFPAYDPPESEAMLGRVKQALARKSQEGWAIPSLGLALVFAPRFSDYLWLVTEIGRDYDPGVAEAASACSDEQSTLIIHATDESWPVDATLWAFDVLAARPKTWPSNSLDIHDAACPFGDASILAWWATGLTAAQVVNQLEAGQTRPDLAPFVAADIPVLLAATANSAGFSAEETTEILRSRDGVQRLRMAAALQDG